MVWVWVVVAAALGGVLMVALFAVSLWRRTRTLVAEVGVLSGHLGAALGLVERIEVAPAGRGRGPASTDF